MLQLDAVTEQVKIAVEADINFIDTANVHTFGESETLLGPRYRSKQPVTD